MRPLPEEAVSVADKRNNRCNDLIRIAQLDVAKERQKQQCELDRVNAALFSLEKEQKMNGREHVIGNEKPKDSWLHESYEFGGLRELRHQVNQYTNLVQRIINSSGQNRCKSFEHENFLEKPRDNSNEQNGFIRPRIVSKESDLHSDNNHLRKHLAMTGTSTVEVLPSSVVPQSAQSITKCHCGNSPIHTRSQEVLSAARQSVKYQRVHSASEHGSLMQLIKPADNSRRPLHPFLPQAGSDSHSLHAAAQRVLGSVKRFLPGFHQTATTILHSNVTDMVSTFAVALRLYDDRVLSKIKLLFEKYDSPIDSAERTKIMCEIDHLYKISRSAKSKREQLLNIVHGPYDQGVNCPPLRQLKILQAVFNSGPL